MNETIHSTWGDYLPNEIHNSTPAGVSIWYLGCQGFVLKANDGTTLFIDPYLGSGDPPRTVRMIPVPFHPSAIHHSDAILATHDHTDHVHAESQAPILSKHKSSYYAPDASLSKIESENWVENWDVDPSQFIEVSEGDSFSVGSFTIHVEPAHDPGARHPVSYIIQHKTGTFFHGGDTKPHPCLDDIGAKYDIDLGALAFGSSGIILNKKTRKPKLTKWYCDESDIIQASCQLRLKRLIPAHWDMWKGLTADPSSLVPHARGFEFPHHIEVVEIGDMLTL